MVSRNVLLLKLIRSLV